MKNYTVTFTEPEMSALSALMDAGVKHLGLRSATDAAVLINKLSNAEVSETSDEVTG